MSTIDGDYVPLMREELSVTGDDLRAPQWRADEIAPDRRFTVAIIGAGMSGILAAHRLRQAGVEFVIYEKNHDVGGTWLENTYPGCRVDVSNHVYSYSFAQRNDWPYYFSPQPELLDYFRTCADEFGVREHVRFGHEVTAMTWSDDAQVWTLEIDGPDGENDTRRSMRSSPRSASSTVRTCRPSTAWTTSPGRRSIPLGGTTMSTSTTSTWW